MKSWVDVRCWDELSHVKNSNAADPWGWPGLPPGPSANVDNACRKYQSQCLSTHLQDGHSLRLLPYQESLTGLLIRLYIIMYWVSRTGCYCCSVWAHGSLVPALCYLCLSFLHSLSPQSCQDQSHAGCNIKAPLVPWWCLIWSPGMCSQAIKSPGSIKLCQLKCSVYSQ